AMDEFSGIFEKGWSAIKELTRIGWEGLHAAVLAVWDTLIRPWLADLPANMLSALGDLAGLLAGAGKDLLDGLGKAARDAWVNVRTWLNNLPTNTKSAIGSLSSVLWSAGV